MPFIKTLPDTLINKIAAGEVVERPASVVKELVENAVDAGATEVFVDIEQAGKRLIRVADNGGGIPREQVRAAFERHATSKIANERDLEAISTMGFRGEALSSIASVSQVRMLTAVRGAPSGALIEIDGGAVRELSEAAAPQGTSIEVNHLFYNTPARLKFLKSAGTEFSHILAAASRQALANTALRIRLTHNKRTVLDLPPARDIGERVLQLYGTELARDLIPVSGSRDGVTVQGLVSKPFHTRSDRSHQEFYVNGRFIRNPSLSHGLSDAYRELLMRDRHPVGFLFITIDPSLVDVNVHPAKAEVRFRSQSQVHDLVRDAVREALRGVHLPSTGEHAGRVAEAAADYLAGAGSGTRGVGGPEPEVRSAANGDHGMWSAGAGLEGAAPGLFVSSQTERAGSKAAFLQPLAQIHDSFIVAQSNEGMALIDQHAAHERVLFEKLQDRYDRGAAPVQDLLIPVQVELGPAEQELLTELLPELKRSGLEVERFGGTTFVIKAVPALLTGADAQRLLLDILDEVRAQGRSGRAEAVRDEILSVMACHPAVKVHRRLSMTEMEGLIGDLFSCRMPLSCPHGRPTVVRFSMDEIKRMFKRI